MSSGALRTSVRELLHNFVSTQEADGEHVAGDILRMLQEESRLLYETQCIRDLLDQDPFQCYGSDGNIKKLIARFQKSLQVVSCFRMDQDDNSCLQEAVVRIKATSTVPSTTTASPRHKKQKRQPQSTSTSIVQLHFRYERTPATEETATALWYSIDLSQDYGPKQNIVTIRVWADGNKPSKLPAVSIEDGGEEEDGWEDIDSDEEEEEKKTKEEEKKDASSRPPPKNGEKLEESDNNKEENSPEKDPRDRYACFVDPDVLLAFQEAAQLTTLDEATAFFTLITFPYYQQEWDLVGFVLDSVFGCNDEEEGSGGEEEEEDGSEED